MAQRNVAQAATLLPLAIGLAMNGRPPKQPRTAISPTVVSSARRAATPRASGGPFELPEGCSLPYNGAENSDIDTRCPFQGGGTGAAKQAQSRAKNDLCVATDHVQPITYQQLKQKQQDANNLNLKNLDNREPLTNLGEGMYVEYIAFIQDAHYSDVGSGEAVNCNIPGDSTNDIHIVLVQDPNDDPCESTTAEMIPHYRPAAWTEANVDSDALKQHPVRVRGPLFYDDAHKPCSGSSRPAPNRISLWEIHPVYSLDVCRLTDLNECQTSTNSGDWDSLEDWIKGQH